MASIVVPKPGTELGPCAGACAHKDCAQHRVDAAQRCAICSKPIGYETPYVCVTGVEAPAHEACAREALEGDAPTGVYRGTSTKEG